jgi:hypothetical protein
MQYIGTRENESGQNERQDLSRHKLRTGGIMRELIGQLNRILVDYQTRGRKPQMVLEVIAGLTHEVEKECGALPSFMAKIQLVINGWKDGYRPDHDALESIAGLVRRQPTTSRRRIRETQLPSYRAS